jgi:hypothetical protein
LQRRRRQLNLGFGVAILAHRGINDSADVKRRIGFPGRAHPLGLAAQAIAGKAGTEQAVR